MTKMSQQQKDSRKYMRDVLTDLIECNKLDIDDEEYVSIETIKEIIHDCPEYDVTSAEKGKWLLKLK